MKPKTRSSLIAATALLTLLSLPAMAMAGAAANTRHASMYLRGTNGFGIRVDGLGAHRVEIEAGDGTSSATYDTQGHVSADGRIHADFGKLGHVSLRFENPADHTRVIEHGAGCKKSETTKEFGVFRGAIVFNGEQGYTAASAHRVKGKLEWSTKRACPSRHDVTKRGDARLERRSGSASTPGFDPITIETVSPPQGEGLSFTADRVNTNEEWSFQADLGEHREGVRIFRFTDVFAEPDAVQLSDNGHHPASATLSPPAPFSGTAVYARGATPTTGTVTGSLSVSLPGAGQIPVPGPGVRATACHFKNLDKYVNCVVAIELAIARSHDG